MFSFRLLLSVCIVTNFIPSLQSTPQSGSFTTGDGSKCTWFDLRLSFSKLALATACVCKDINGQSQSYGCQYTGALYSCEWFNSNHMEALFGLVQQLSALNSSCEVPEVVVPECSQVPMEREMLHEVNSPCVYQKTVNHKEL